VEVLQSLALLRPPVEKKLYRLEMSLGLYFLGLMPTDQHAQAHRNWSMKRPYQSPEQSHSTENTWANVSNDKPYTNSG